MLTAERIKEINDERAAEERCRDAGALAQYQRDCLASWEGKETNVRLA